MEKNKKNINMAFSNKWVLFYATPKLVFAPSCVLTGSAKYESFADFNPAKVIFPFLAN